MKLSVLKKRFDDLNLPQKIVVSAPTINEGKQICDTIINIIAKYGDLKVDYFIGQYHGMPMYMLSI